MDSSALLSALENEALCAAFEEHLTAAGLNVRDVAFWKELMHFQKLVDKTEIQAAATRIIKSYITVSLLERVDLPPEMCAELASNSALSSPSPAMFDEALSYMDKLLLEEYSNKFSKAWDDADESPTQDEDSLTQTFMLSNSDSSDDSSFREMSSFSGSLTASSTIELAPEGASPLPAQDMEPFVGGKVDDSPSAGLYLFDTPIGLPLVHSAVVNEISNQATVHHVPNNKACLVIPAAHAKLKNPAWNDMIETLIQDSISPTLLGTKMDDSVASNDILVDLTAIIIEQSAAPGASGCFQAADNEAGGAGEIGTLFFILPSVYQGGSIIIQQNGVVKEYQTDPASNPELEFSPFYLAFRTGADLCQSKPLISGMRVVLVYKISLRFGGQGKTLIRSTSSARSFSMKLDALTTKTAADSAAAAAVVTQMFDPMTVDAEDLFSLESLIRDAGIDTTIMASESQTMDESFDASVAEGSDVTTAGTAAGAGSAASSSASATVVPGGYSMPQILYTATQGGSTARNMVSFATFDGLLSVLAQQQDTAFLDTFVITYEYFTTTSELIRKLILLFFVFKKQEHVVSQLRVVNVLKKLIELRYWQIKDDKLCYNMIAKTLNFLLFQGDEHDRNWARTLRHSIEQNSEFKRPQDSIDPPSPRTLKSLSSLPKPEKRTVMDFSTRQMARHLTLVDHELWSKINIQEFYHKAFEKDSKNIKCPNLQKYIKRFNAVSGWVAGSILQTQKRKDRVGIVTKFVRIMYELKQIRNFNGMMAIFGALNFTAIQRLKKTWKEVPKKAMELFHAVSDVLPSSGNMKAYRDMVREAAAPCLPFCGFMLTDLIYTEEMPTYVALAEIARNDRALQPFTNTEEPDAAFSMIPAEAEEHAKGYKMINWKKMKQLFGIIGDVMKFQRTRYPYVEVKEIAEFVSDPGKHCWLLSEEQMLEMVSVLEPPDNPPASASPAGVGGAPAASPEQSASASAAGPTKDAPGSPQATSLDLVSRLKRRGSTRKSISPATFDDISRDVLAFHEFAKFLRSRFNEEYLLFWDACYRFKATYKEGPDTQRKAQDIVSKFITGESHNGQYAIGIDAAIARKLRAQVKDRQPEPTMFDKAVKVIEETTLRPAYIEFAPSAPMTLHRRDSSSSSPMKISTSSGSLGSPSSSSPSESPKAESKKKDKSSKKTKERSESSAAPTAASAAPVGNPYAKNPPVFEDLQKDPQLLKAFHVFLDSRMCGETLVFWEAVFSYKHLVDHSNAAELKKTAEQIYKKFITGETDGGAFHIGLNTSLARQIKGRIDRSENLSNTFDTAVTEVEEVSLRPAFPEFARSYKPS